MRKAFILCLFSVAAFGAPPGTIVNPAANTSATTTEVLVLASASTSVPTTPMTDRKYLAIQNRGPNAITCKFSTAGTAAVLNTSWNIPAGTSLAMDAGPAILVRCIAATLDQVTTAATIVLESK
jgi:hypothetical protein